MLHFSLSYAAAIRDPSKLTKRWRHFHEVVQHEQQRCLHAHLSYAPAHYRMELQVPFKAD
jgi:hypothetical protein